MVLLIPVLALVFLFSLLESINRIVRRASWQWAGVLASTAFAGLVCLVIWIAA